MTVNLKGKRVVLCEDEGVVLMHLRRILTRAGMVIAGQTNRGDEALDIVAKERPDIVLMDIELVDMDGLKATQRILEGAAEPLCIVILTAYTDEEHIRQAWDVGACAYITKPIEPGAFVRHLEQAYETFQKVPKKEEGGD
ncbi:MAG TPA: response regulator [Chthonomonadaceae bacterium]|nr:response regulator [Chthonomonadaceae bacterium]